MFVHKTGVSKHKLLNKISYTLFFKSKLWFLLKVSYVYLALHITEELYLYGFWTHIFHLKGNVI